jgi:hypothetical protein
MSTSDRLANHNNHDVERYIEQNLSAYQLRWLTMQSQALGYPRSSIFEAILSDWLSRHSSRNRQHMAEVDIARRAVDEFISRHQNTFLP